MRWGLYAGVFAAGLLMGAAPPEFRGCGGGDDLPEGGTPLPEGEGCVRDSDCAGMDECADVRCLAGACMEVGPLIDRDGDGRAPSPCGDDCDDTRADVFSGAVERCDGRDNDCDGEIDDGAPRLDTTYQLTEGDASSVLLPWGQGFLLTEATASVLWGIPVAVDGSTGTPLELMRLTGGSGFVDVAGAAAADGRVMIASLTDFGTLRYLVLVRETDGRPRVVEGPSTVDTPSEVGQIGLIAFGDGWALGYDANTPLGPQRVVALDPAAEPTVRVDLTSIDTTSFGLATDGTHVVVSDDAGTVFFMLPDGTEVASHALAAALPPRPLASGSGSVVAVIPDDFDYNLAHVDAATGRGSLSPAPFGDESDRLYVARAGGLVVVGRVATGQTRVQALEDDLSTFAGEALTLGGRGTVAQLSIADADGVVGVAGGLSGIPGADLAILLACSM